MKLDSLNFSAFTQRFVFPFYFDIFNKKPLRYSLYNYDYVEFPKIYRSFFFLDPNLKGIFKLPFFYFYNLFHLRLKTSRLYF